MKHFGRIAVVYLIALFVGGVYVGLIAPLRTVIQTDMGIDSTLGIWMINIYTLFYASTIPITGSLADRYGRKPVFLSCIGIFTFGSMMCGFAQFTGGLPLLLAGRVIQAFGAGGVIPVSTAEMGVSAPPEKRGMWLGITASVAGIANVIGAALGSVVIAIVGAQAWCWAFFIVLPIGIFLIIAGLAWLPASESKPQGSLDILGSILFVIFVITLLMGLKNLTTPSFEGLVLPVIIAVVFAIAFLLVERKASAPIFHLEYLTNRNLVVVLIVSFFVGCFIISMQLVPEFAEYALGTSLGSGGYYMSVIGVFAIAGPIMCGKFVDRYGAKPVLIAGLAVTALGFLFLALVVTSFPSVLLMIIGLGIVGLGMGFTMGTPLNYMTLANTDPEQSNSAIATVSLLRQMGTTIAPSVFVSFTAASAGIAGYSHMLVSVAICCAVSILVMFFYVEVKKLQ